MKSSTKTKTIHKPKRKPADKWVVIAEIDAVAAEINKCYNDVNPHAQAACLRLASALAVLRETVRVGRLGK